MRLGRIGFDHVLGFLSGGPAALDADPALRPRIARTDRITALSLAEELRGDAPPFVLDVRTPGERAAGFVAGSHHLPLSKLTQRLERGKFRLFMVVGVKQDAKLGELGYELLEFCPHAADETDEEFVRPVEEPGRLQFDEELADDGLPSRGKKYVEKTIKGPAVTRSSRDRIGR